MASSMSVSVEDLRSALSVLGYYETEDGRPIMHLPYESLDEERQSIRRVMAWIEAEAARREAEAVTRRLKAALREHGLPVTDQNVERLRAKLAKGKA